MVDHKSDADPLSDVSALQSGTYLGAKDVKDGDVTFAVRSAAIEEFEGKDGKKGERKLVLTLDEDPVQKLSLNDTNLTMLIAAWGKDARRWAGKLFEAYFDPTVRDPSGKKTGGLRVRPRPAPRVALTQPAKHTNGSEAAADSELVDDEIPFHA